MSEPLRRPAPIKHLCSRVGLLLAVLGISGFAATTGSAAGLPSSGIDSRATTSPVIADRLQFAQKTKSGDDLLTDTDDLLTDTDDLLTDKDDLLLDKDTDDVEDKPRRVRSRRRGGGRQAREDHEALSKESRFPSAAKCGECHPRQYEQWSVSQHSYSQLSPVYLSLNNRILELTNGSDGDFCLRCHSQVGANLGESPMISNLKRHPTSREGITCVVCHRQDTSYNKVSGRLALVEGHITEPVFGPKGNAEMVRVLNNPGDYPVVIDPKKSGLAIHKEVKFFAPISTPIFCGTCHDVTLFNGFRLEEAFSEYRMSPAAAAGVTCQDCHMGRVQGKKIAEGDKNYDFGPGAEIDGRPTTPRKLTDHFFAGPDYSIIHPGIFPHNVNAQRIASLEQWLEFKYKERWGIKAFEDDPKTKKIKFPEHWKFRADRERAREILEKEQFVRLRLARTKRLQVLHNGYLLQDVVVDRADRGGIVFRVKVANGHDGHNSPTGFTGERQVWLKVTVTDRDGKIVFRSGDADLNGDLRDDHSAFVHAHKVPIDEHLFSLQSAFLVQSGRGAELPQVVPIPYPFTSLPRVLPAPLSLIFTGEPPTERNHKKGIEPLGHRWAEYPIDGDALTGKGPYKARIELRSQMVPVNLINAIQSVGFDYFMSPREVADALVKRGDCLWVNDFTINLDAGGAGPARTGSMSKATKKCENLNKPY